MTEPEKRSADQGGDTVVTDNETTATISTAEQNMFMDGLGASSSQQEPDEEVQTVHDLETIQDAVQTAVLAIKTQREPIRQLRLVVEALRDAVETDRMGKDPDFAKYVNERLGARLMQNMSRETSVDDEYLEVCADVQESYIRLFLSQLRRKRFHDDFICAITWCFQPQCKIHMTHFQFTREELKQIAMSHQTWRNEITIDSMIDIQITKQSKMTGWMQGKVVDATGDLLSVRFEDSPPEFDKMIDRWSTKIAESGTKTTEDYEWRRQTLHGATDLLIDCFDGTDYLEATIFETKVEEEAPGRFVEYAYVAFRVYRDYGKKMREDERGVFDGWSKKYDEWVPIYGPQIVPHMTKSQGKASNVEEMDEELDGVIKPSFGFNRVFAVPRIYSCLSKKFLYFMDMFGNGGGFDLILEAMESQELDDKNLTLTALCYMITLMSMPCKLWHKDFVEEYGERFCNAISKRLVESNDDKIRELDMSASQQAVIAVGMILGRVKTRTDARKDQEELKLKFVKKCLESQYLEKRIQGIKELNEIIGNTTTQGDSQMTQDLINWIQENQVFTAIWDPKKTHLQLVQRSGDIFRMLLKEDLLSEDLLKQFWNLTKSDYKLEIFKILNDCEYSLEQPQIEFIFDQITLTPATKLGIEEFDVLSMLGRICKLTDFSQKVSMYFWRIICDSDAYNQELLDQCVSKFSQMIKYSSIGIKKPFFLQLSEFLKNSTAPTIPVLRLFQKIISDHKDRERLANKKTTGSAGGINYGNVPKWAPNSEPVEVQKVFEELEESQSFSEAILKNLAAYFGEICGKKIDAGVDRTELHLVSEKYSHHAEVDERLKFLQTYAANSSFEFSKVELKVIYDLLASSPVKGDLEELLKWCKSACEKVTDKIVDLNAIGEFFAEQIQSNVLDLKLMPTTGFQLIQMFYVNSNANANNILKQEKPKKKKKTQKFSQWDTNFYGNLWNEDPPKEEEQEEDSEDEMPFFTVYSDPSTLLFIDMVWSIALESQVEAVHKAATSLLVFSYLSLESQSQTEEARYTSMQSLLTKCFDLIDPEKNPSSHTVTRVNQVIKEVIQQSETKGDCGIRPHRSILKGELLDRVLVKFMGSKNVWGEEKLERAIVIKLYTSCTVWEFKSEVAKLLGLAPKYLEFELPNDKLLNDKEHGKDMQQLGVKNNAIITARKISLKENIPQAALVDPESQWLTPKAEEIFTEWFNTFKNPIKKKMDNFSVARFITRTTKTSCISSEPKVQELIQSYDTTQDGCLDLQEFLQFYYDAACQPGERRQACFKNLKNLNVRPDLVKLSDVVETSLFSAKQWMPRFALQANEAQYQTLWKLLERNDETCAKTWELIRMLATNEKQYMEVIRMDSVTDEEGQVDWTTFFKGSSEYQKSYLQEIILSVLEDSEESESSKRVMFVAEQKVNTTSYGATSSTKPADDKAPGSPTVGDQESKENGEGSENEDSKKEAEIVELRLNWSRNFLERGGFQHVMAQVYALDIHQGDTKQIEFMMTLVRVFLTAAFATDTNKHIGKAIKLARKSSSIDDSDTFQSKTKKEVKRDPLLELLHGEYGMEILLSTNYERLQQKILTLVFSILEKAELSLNEKIIVENAISVQVGSILYKPELFDDFLAFKHGEKTIEDLILSGLVTCKEEKIRQDFYQGVLALASSLEGETKLRAQRFFIGVLGKNFNRIADVSCTQYFDLFNEMIDLKAMQDGLVSEDLQEEDAPYDPKTLLGQIIDQIVASQKSKTASKDQEEPVLDEITASEIAAGKERSLVGLITLTKKIMQTAQTAVSDQVIQEKNLIDLLFKDFLFASYFQAQKDKANGVKKEIEMVQRVGAQRNVAVAQVTSNHRSREAAFSLLIELVKKSGLTMENFLEKVLLPMLMSVEKPKVWGYKPQITESGEGRGQEYVGLRNLGCICYMNSMMQQFFMIPALRYNLLCVDDGKSEELVEYKGKRVDDNMFHQMQKLFAHLELSQRSDYNPFGFCFAFKEFDGNPTNTSEQKDAQEFLNLFFDRLETALKPTPRKYLLEGIFGGKQCSQMVCTECGKVKNRHEVFYNLSLNIKDIKSIHESLAKQVEGEIISDYQCDGCNRKVDLSKRTLIAETPNVLIVHLQRIVFNFDTFENDKVNTLAKFPTMLDLKPYSYFEVMGKEHRLKEQEEANDSSTKPKKDEEDVLTEEEIKKRKEEEEEKREPIKEDCFEYKLVGVNVHSGTANMGHYWSYINTNRGVEEDKDPNWVRTEADPWMEFNDSRVSNWDFKEMEKECFGNEAGQSFMGDSYGTSGYMLFYERRKKKDLKILVEDAHVEAEKAKGVEVQFDEEKKEHFKMMPYRQAADGEKPNPIYQQVFEDNHSVSFENDVYSQEFFDFVLKIMKGVADSDSASAKETGLEIGKKVGFEILSRCFENTGLKHLQVAMIDILRSSDKACLDFMRALLDDDDCEPVMEILFSCPDSQARKNLIRIIRYLVCRLKLIEKELILANDFEEYDETVIDAYGEQQTRRRTQPVALVLRFMATLKAYMHVRAAKAWKIIDTYTELLFSFGVHSPENFDTESAGREKWSRESEGYQIGMLEYFRNDFLTVIGDFILQDASPLYKGSTDYRLQMGNYYISPDFDTALELITVMISDSEMQARYPFSENAQRIVVSKEILKQLIKAFANMLNMMCTNNYQFSKKMAKTYIREFLNKNQTEDIQKGLKQLRSFLLIKDNLRQIRFEWIFGVPQAYAKRNYQKKTLEIANCESKFINVECTQYKSGVVKGAGDALLTDMFKAMKTRAEFTIYALYELISLCIEDEHICAYIYKMPPPTHQYARYCDWFESFAMNHRAYLLEQGQRYTAYQDLQNKENVALLTQILSLLPTFKEKCAPYEAAWKQARSAAPADGFEGLKSVSMVGSNEEVLDHYPPLYIIGQPIDSMQNVIYEEDIDDVSVKIIALTCEYMYSNPTGLYNLSLPDLKLRNHLNFKAKEQNYVQWKKSQSSGVAPELDESNQAADDDQDVEDENEYMGHDVRLWEEHSCVGEVLLRIEVVNYSRCQIKLEIGVEQDQEDTTPLNCHLPLTSFFQQIMASNISAKPVTGFIQKIDPTKPFGKIKPTIGVKRVRSAGGSYATSGSTMATGGRTTNEIDPTSTQAYKDVVSSIRNGNVGGPRSVGFFVSEGNLGHQDGQNENVQTSGRRNGVNLGHVQPIEDLGGEAEEDLVIEGKAMEGNDEDVDSMGFGYQSDQDRQNEHFGSDLEDDLQKL